MPRHAGTSYPAVPAVPSSRRASNALLPDGPRCWRNQLAASSVTWSRAPGSSNRWLAPGIVRIWRVPPSWLAAARFSPATSVSRPPTISSTGMRACPSARPGQVRAAAAGYHRADTSRARGSGGEGGGGSRAGPEQPERHAWWLTGVQPVDRGGQPPAEQADVEAQRGSLRVGAFLVVGQQVQQQRPQARPVQARGHRAVARAAPGATAAVGEQHHAGRGIGPGKVTGESCVVGIHQHRGGGDLLIGPCESSDSSYFIGNLPDQAGTRRLEADPFPRRENSLKQRGNPGAGSCGRTLASRQLTDRDEGLAAADLLTVVPHVSQVEGVPG